MSKNPESVLFVRWVLQISQTGYNGMGSEG